MSPLEILNPTTLAYETISFLLAGTASDGIVMAPSAVSQHRAENRTGSLFTTAFTVPVTGNGVFSTVTGVDDLLSPSALSAKGPRMTNPESAAHTAARWRARRNEFGIDLLLVDVYPAFAR
jgi:hypothetical protein